MYPSSRIWIIAAALAAVLGGAIFVAVTFTQQPEEIPVVEEAGPKREVIGASVEGRAIEAYSYLPARGAQAGGDGTRRLLFVGGIHGGYEWNSVVLAYQFMDYLSEDPARIPSDLTVSVIPNANPDGVYAVIGKEGRFGAADVPDDEGPAGTGRFNARGVDLNRNFDCKWQPESMWRGNVVSAGSVPFSEPESRAIRDFVLATQPDAAVFWHSQSNAVYASECEDGILPQTRAVMTAYANAAGYPAVDSFDAYEITGDAEGWLASIGIPAITVELSTHETIEWEKNLAGIKALLSLYSEAE